MKHKRDGESVRVPIRQHRKEMGWKKRRDKPLSGDETVYAGKRGRKGEFGI
jgi:hypothetical protein